MYMNLKTLETLLGQWINLDLGILLLLSLFSPSYHSTHIYFLLFNDIKDIPSIQKYSFFQSEILLVFALLAKRFTQMNVQNGTIP